MQGKVIMQTKNIFWAQSEKNKRGMFKTKLACWTSYQCTTK